MFAEVAQQVLEYLGVPHDQPLKTKKEMMASAQKDAVGGCSFGEYGGFECDV